MATASAVKFVKSISLPSYQQSSVNGSSITYISLHTSRRVVAVMPVPLPKKSSSHRQ
jgi:hypothetical protein